MLSIRYHAKSDGRPQSHHYADDLTFGNMANDDDILNVYIDESVLKIGANTAILYAMAMPRNLNASIRKLHAIRTKYSLDDSIEIKWTLKHSDIKKKAEIKQGVIEELADGFRCMISITQGDDKDRAFTNVLQQIQSHALRENVRYVNIYYDQDAFRSPSKIRKELNRWEGIRCTTLAQLDSFYSPPIQYADMLAGVFRYMINASLGRKTPTIKVYDEGLGDIEFNLDEFFHVLFRYSMVGTSPMIDADTDFRDQDLILNAFGTGIVVHGEFSSDELEAIKGISQFYLGCMH